MMRRQSKDPLLDANPRKSRSGAADEVSGVLDLRAELLRTKELVNAAKARRSTPDSAAAVLAPGDDVAARTNASRLDPKFVNALSKRDRDRLRESLKPAQASSKGAATEEDMPEGPSWDEMQAALRAKQARYEELERTGGLDELEKDPDAQPLIDFVAKRYDQIQRRHEGDDSSTDGGYSRRTRRSYRSDDEEMIETVDEFGRTRLVPASSLRPRSASPGWSGGEGDYRDRPPSPARINAPDHYDAKREVRTLGVAFYHLSQSADERSAQLAELRRLREETLAALSPMSAE
ncbi:hypothetical protein H9P43_000099 [Blastocladiella emersonii ATCC 22665]|nr:hypothetical protein H9P43_000099 [Blastocladiella emersonii ATCC 22665]